MLTEAYEAIEGMGDVLIVADHASAAVPGDIDLGLPAELFSQHIAVDIGVASLAATFCARHSWGAVLGGVSRLVIDLNREPDHAGLVPIESDGRFIPGNKDVGVAERIARFWEPYHAAIAAATAAQRPRMLLSLHSFTPRLESRPDIVRPWEVGVLYNQDERAARIAIPLLEAAGVVTGDNLPYSGKVLNATMNRHAEANGLPYLGIEVRQDLIGDDAAVARWAGRLGPIIAAVAEAVR